MLGFFPPLLVLCRWFEVWCAKGCRVETSLFASLSRAPHAPRCEQQLGPILPSIGILGKCRSCSCSAASVADADSLSLRLSAERSLWFEAPPTVRKVELHCGKQMTWLLVAMLLANVFPHSDHLTATNTCHHTKSAWLKNG